MSSSVTTLNGAEAEPFSNLMETLLTNLMGLRAKLDDNSKTTSSLLNKASSLRKQIKSTSNGNTGNIPSPISSPTLNGSNTSNRNLDNFERLRQQLQQQTPLDLSKDLTSSKIQGSPTKNQEQPTETTELPTNNQNQNQASGITEQSSKIQQPQEQHLNSFHQPGTAHLLEKEKELLHIISYLERENQSLCDSVEECYSTLDLAMDRYKAEAEALRINKANANYYKSIFEREKTENECLRMENIALKQKIEHTLAVMQIACAEDDQVSREEEAFSVQLSIENENLRQLLQISERMSNVS